MPASRSRTNEWKRSLQQVFDRGGAIEFAVVRPGSRPEDDEFAMQSPGGDLVWRVKVLSLEVDSMIVEAPMALGRNIEIGPGIELVGAIAIGQNRWVFRTRNIGDAPTVSERSRSRQALRLALPEQVRRCQRRSRRFDARDLQLPEVEAWPLLDPKSVMPIERAVEIAWSKIKVGESVNLDEMQSDVIMPTVGPRFAATLMNLGGGGIGLRVESDASQALTRHRIFWIKMPLTPELTIPISVTGKVVHTHIDSLQRTYVGIAFDFTFNHGYQDLVAELIATYIERVQNAQLDARKLDDSA